MVESQDVSVVFWSTRRVPAGKSNEVFYASCVRRAALQRRPLAAPIEHSDGGPALWFVKVTVGGDSLTPEQVRQALEELSVERAFLVSARFDSDRADVRYWDECDHADEAIRQALSLWGDDEVFARLPGWTVIGLEVVDQQTARRQWDRGDHPRVFMLGEILPFD
jgi:hypothetical protein